MANEQVFTALTEPDVGSDAATLSNRAVKDGDDYCGNKRMYQRRPVAYQRIQG
ncbi:hypothetical protein ACM7YY_32620 [Pseudomonas aeruginosa]|uniref:hypothetical protein n=1 Tax=Pseudomonas sp. TaxID=306 RepID=UPI0029BB8401|nr:hypothetical protein [Pseudomonas sp.]MDX3744421.1 hypothetical protein [Pseudomonas sp.]